MWLFTKYGFYSITETCNGNVQVRAREADDLDAMREEYMPALGQTFTTLHADYPFRAFCTKDELAEAMGRIVHDINYTNFKGEVGEIDPDRVKIYHQVWADLLDIESLETFHARERARRAPRRQGKKGKGKSQKLPFVDPRDVVATSTGWKVNA